MNNWLRKLFGKSKPEVPKDTAFYQSMKAKQQELTQQLVAFIVASEERKAVARGHCLSEADRIKIIKEIEFALQNPGLYTDIEYRSNRSNSSCSSSPVSGR
jgi:hypothetical protein